jgi:predicted nucleotidyltransferase
MIDLDPKHLETIQEILREHVPACKVLAFGSRVTGKAHRFSDLDLALVCETPIDRRLIESLKEVFSESDLPFMVDILDYNSLSESFRAIMNERLEIVQTPALPT